MTPSAEWAVDNEGCKYDAISIVQTDEQDNPRREKDEMPPMEYDQIRLELARAGRELLDQKLIRTWSGQLSARLPLADGDYDVVIKASGAYMDRPEAFCRVDKGGSLIEPLGAKPSLMTKVHCAIYEKTAGIGAVVQYRGVYTDAVVTVLGTFPKSLETFWCFDTEPRVIPIDGLQSDNILAFRDKAAEAVGNMLESGPIPTIICVPFYGAWAIGSDVTEAVRRAEAAEDLAQSAYLREALAFSKSNTVPEMPDWFVNVLRDARRPK